MAYKQLSKTGAGVGFGLFSGMTWGLNTVIIGLILAMTPFTSSKRAIFLAPFAGTFLHDAFSAMWLLLFHLAKGEIKQVYESIKTKSGFYIMLGALLGGPLGMTCYMLSVKYIGASYAAAISSMYPAVGAIFAFMFLKEKLSKGIWAGIALSITGVIVLGYQPGGALFQGDFLLGILFALGTVLGWGLESVICAYGMKEAVTAEHALNIRQLTSGIFYGLIILPFIGGHVLVKDVISEKAGLFIAFAAFIGTVSYMFYYKAIRTIGAARSTALNITFAIWAIIIQVVFFKATVTLRLITGCIIAVFGAILVSSNQRNV